MATWKKIIVSGSNAELNQLTVAGASGSFSGSFTGSIASASYATTSSYAISSSFASTATSASFATSASVATTASYVLPLDQPKVEILGQLQQGFETTASGQFAVALGKKSKAFGESSFAHGVDTSALGTGAHAEGSGSVAMGTYSHAGGNNTFAEGEWSNTLGEYTKAQGTGSSAAGLAVTTSADYSTAIGQFNIDTPATASFVIGNGSDATNRSNLLYAHDNQIEITGSVKVDGAVSASVFSGSFVGDGSQLSGVAGKLKFSSKASGSGVVSGSVDLNTEWLNITGSATQINTSASGNNLFITLADNVQMQTASIANDLTVQGNLYVNGTASYINTQDLYVEDKFILLNSGSVGASDGGIIIDRGSYVSQSVAYGYDSGTNRFGFQNNIADSADLIDLANNPTNSAFVGTVVTEAAHGVVTGPSFGNSEFVQAGTIYTDNAGDIFIFS